MVEPALLEILACPRCKGGLAPAQDGGGLACPSCAVVYPVRNGIPVLLVEEAGSMESRTIPRAEGLQVRFVVVEGKNKGEIIEVEKGTCRAVGRSLDDAERTRVFSVESSVTLDDNSKKLVMNYVATQFHKASSPATGDAESIGAFRRQADIWLKDASVSRLHAMFFYDEGGVGVLDLVSKNGTFVNGAEVESKILKKGDLVMIGATKLRME